MARTKTMQAATAHANARVARNRDRQNWKAFYDVKGRRAIGELWEPVHNPATGEFLGNTVKCRDFNVRINDDGTFRVDIGTGSGVKVMFLHK